MSGEICGYFLAVLSMCVYGVYMSPKKLSGLSDSRFTFWMACGIIISAALVRTVFPPVPEVRSRMLVSFLAGLVWATSNFAYTLSISRIELTRSTPIKNLSALFGLLLGMALLSEGADKTPLKAACICVSGILVVTGAWLLSRVGAVSGGRRVLSRGDYVSGCLLALWSAVSFSIYTVPMKLCFRQGMAPEAFLFYMSAGIFAGMALLALLAGWRPGFSGLAAAVRNRDRAYARSRLMALASGAGLTLGQLMANYAVKLAGVAVVWPITKNSVAAVLFSAFVLKDVNWRDSREYMFWGALMCFAGIIIMGFGA